jgi:hypothetical protein
MDGNVPERKNARVFATRAFLLGGAGDGLLSRALSNGVPSAL